MVIEYADAGSTEWLLASDGHMQPDALRRKLTNQEILIARSETGPTGFLRFGYFWDEIPFMNMLIISAPYRQQGIGTKLVSYWESEMKRQGHGMIMTSSLSDETAQHFYRKLGYRDAGSLFLPREALEIIFLKELSP